MVKGLQWRPHTLHASTMTPCFYSVLGFFCKLSWLWSSLLLSLQAVSSQPTAVLSLDPLSKSHFPAHSPSPHQETHNSGVQGCGMDHACSSYFVLPSTDWLLHSTLIPQRSLSAPTDFPTLGGFLHVGTYPHL